MLIKIGAFVFGFYFGYLTSLSKVPSTITKAIGVLSGIIPLAVSWWFAVAGLTGLVLTCAGLGFSMGIVIGSILGRKNLWDVFALSISYRIHHQASILEVAVIQSLLVGLPLGILILWALAL